MIKDDAKIKGKVIATVRDKNGNIKLFTWKQIIWNAIRYFKFSKLMICVNHNIVTDQGDALIADLMSQTPARNKVNNANGYIEVGTAYSAVGAKQQTGCHTPTGSREAMDATYPKQKGAWGAASDNVVQYMATFEAGDLNATINEASLHNAAMAGDCLAYAAITPSAIVGTTDSISVLWELTVLGV